MKSLAFRPLSVVAGLGLSGSEMVSTINLVTRYVRGAAQGALEAASAAQQTGVTDDQWWAAREPIFDTYFDPSRYPTLISVHQSGAFDPPVGSGDEYNLHHALNDFQFGLQRVLDGIEAFIARRAG